jgi:hypothetical protein
MYGMVPRYSTNSVPSLMRRQVVALLVPVNSPHSLCRRGFLNRTMAAGWPLMRSGFFAMALINQPFRMFGLVNGYPGDSVPRYGVHEVSRGGS